MRSELLHPLLSHTKQAILTATILQPEKRWYFRELARHLRVQPSSIQRDLAAFAAAGLLERHQDGNRIYYQARRECPIFPELAQILIKTVGLVDVFRDLLKSVQKRINVAFIYGSIASGEARVNSDVDIMIVGSAGLAEIANVLQGIERRLGRQVNPTVYTSEEFRRKIREDRHFIRTVLGSNLLFIQGTQHDLERLAQRSQGQASPDKLRRASRSSSPRRARPQRRKA